MNFIMKKAFFILLIIIASNVHAQAQAYLSGDVVVTNPNKTSVSLNYDFSSGTTGTFTYDGKELSLKIEKKIFNNVSTSAGLGFRPNGETCFYVSLEDGVEIGAINIEGTGTFYGNSLKASLNPSVKLSYCVNWVSNTSFMLTPEIITNQKMLIRPKFSTRMIPSLLLKGRLEIEPALVLKEKNDEYIEAYCLDKDKAVPKLGARFTYSNDSMLDDIRFWDTTEDSFIIQSLLYSYLDGYSISEDELLYVWRGNNSSLFVFNNENNIGFIVKYSNGEYESSIPLPLDYIKKSLNIEKLLQGKLKDRIYFNENNSQDKIQLMKNYLMMFGLKTNEDGSMSAPDCDADLFYEIYSNYITPLLLNYYSSIIKQMERYR